MGMSAVATAPRIATPQRTFTASRPPLVRSYEPGEDWWWCYVDEIVFDVEGEAPSPSHH